MADNIRKWIVSIIIGALTVEYPSIAGTVALLTFLQHLAQRVAAQTSTQTSVVSEHDTKWSLAAAEFAQKMARATGSELAGIAELTHHLATLDIDVREGRQRKANEYSEINLAVGDAWKQIFDKRSTVLEERHRPHAEVFVGLTALAAATRGGAVGVAVGAGIGLAGKYAIDIFGNTFSSSKAAEVENVAYQAQKPQAEIQKLVWRAESYCKQIPTSCDALNKLIWRHTGFDPAKSLNDQAPKYANTLGTARADATGNVRLDLKALSENALKAAEGVDDLRNDMNEIRTALNRSQTLPAYVYVTTLSPSDLGAEKSRYERRTEMLDNAERRLLWVVGIAGKIDPVRAEQIYKVGSSALIIGRSTNDFLNAVKTVSGATKGATALKLLGSATIFSGNMLSAGLTLASLFGGAGQSADALILQELGVVKQMLADLSLQVEKGFASIHASLGQLSRDINAMTFQLRAEILRVDAQAEELRSNIVMLQQTLNAAMAATREWLQVPIVSAQRRRVESCLYAGSTTRLPMTNAELLDCLKGFSTYTSIDATTELTGPVSGRPFTPDAIAAELRKYPPYANGNYVLETVVPRVLGGKAQSTSKLNIAMAAEGIWSQIEMYRQHPDGVGSVVKPAFFDQTISRGREYEKALRRLVGEPDSSGKIKPSPVLPQAISYAEEHVAALNKAERDAFVKWRLENPGVLSFQNGAVLIDPEGGLNQPAHAWYPPQAPIQSYPGCMTLTMDDAISHNNMANIWNVSIPQLYRSAIAAGIAKAADIKFCVDRTEIVLRDRVPGTLRYYLNAIVYFSFYYRDKRIARVKGQGHGNHPDWTGLPTEAGKPAPEAFVRKYFDHTLAYAGGWWQSLPLDAAASAQANSAASEVLTGLQQLVQQAMPQFYSWLASEAGRSGEFQRVVASLIGSKLLLQNIVLLGMPETFERDDAIVSFVSGDGFPEEATLAAWYRAAAARPRQWEKRYSAAEPIVERLRLVRPLLLSAQEQIVATQRTEKHLMLSAGLDALEMIREGLLAGEAASQSCSFTVSPPSLSAGPAGGPLSLSIATGNSCAWSISGLPSWATVSQASGTGPMTITVNVTANQGAARDGSFLCAGKTINVAQLAATMTPVSSPLSMSCPSAQGPGMVGVAYSVECTATRGAPPYNWSIASGTLPNGILLSATTGAMIRVNGVPTTAGAYSYAVRVADSSVPPQTATVQFSGMLAELPPITISCIPAAGPTTSGVPYAAACVGSGGVPPYSWTIGPGPLPAGLSLSTTTGPSVSISGTPTGPGNYDFTLMMTDSAGRTASRRFSGTITVAPSITVSPTTLNFSYVIGSSTTPQPQTVQVTLSVPGVPFTATATTSAGGNWLVVSSSGTGSGPLTVGINPSAITTAGEYTGSIAIASPNPTNPAATVTVRLNVTAVPKPVIRAVANAASYVTGAVSPGQNIVIFGTGIGPAALTMALLENNAFPTTVANTQVFFDNIPAPIIYARADQASVMVPYGVAGRPATNIRVVYSGVQSDAILYNVVAAGPGIYTANSSGTGQGAILNQDYSVNSSARPATKGSVVTVYLTGEGVTSPAGTDGRIAPGDGTGLFKPILPVTATVGGQPATVEYYGTAPRIAYGIMQVNVRIPPSAASGNLSVVVSVGNAATLNTVTVAVQ